MHNRRSVGATRWIRIGIWSAGSRSSRSMDSEDKPWGGNPNRTWLAWRAGMCDSYCEGVASSFPGVVHSARYGRVRTTQRRGSPRSSSLSIAPQPDFDTRGGQKEGTRGIRGPGLSSKSWRLRQRASISEPKSVVVRGASVPVGLQIVPGCGMIGGDVPAPGRPW